MHKIVTVLGARPQFIKAAALSRTIRQQRTISEIIIHTGQHYDENMSDIFFEQMQIPKPDYRLQVTSSHHGAMTGHMMGEIESILEAEKPDAVVVYGDTNSTLAGALAAKKIHVRVVHIEAGLRSFNMRMPEEINRILTDRISDFLFCPSDQAVQNLVAEGYKNFPCEIHQVGDIMKDVAFFYKDLAKRPSFSFPKEFVLATLHRAENTDDPARLAKMISIFNALAIDTAVVLPLHPRTRGRLKDLAVDIHPNIFITDPVGYLEMVYLLSHCGLVVTDSGGLQKEAFFFSKYCVTIREETEWIESVEQGYNILAGADQAKVLSARNSFFNKALVPNPNLYGTGNTAALIVDILRQA